MPMAPPGVLCRCTRLSSKREHAETLARMIADAALPWEMSRLKV